MEVCRASRTVDTPRKNPKQLLQQAGERPFSRQYKSPGAEWWHWVLCIRAGEVDH